MNFNLTLPFSNPDLTYRLSEHNITILPLAYRNWPHSSLAYPKSISLTYLASLPGFEPRALRFTRKDNNDVAKTLKLIAFIRVR